MTQEEFIQKAMIAMLANPSVTTIDNFKSKEHFSDIYIVAARIANEDEMCFDDLGSFTAKHFPECVSDRECLSVIGEALQALANGNTIAEQRKKHNGNFEYRESDELINPA